MLTIEKIPPGARLRIRQKMDKGARVWTATIEGVLLGVCREPTGSWFAHGKNDRYWLARIRMQKENGEETLLSLDQNSIVELLDDPAPTGVR